MAEHRRADACAFHFVWLAIGLTTVLMVQMKVLEFFPLPKAGVGFGLRLSLDLAGPPVFFGLLGFAIWLAVTAMLAVIKRRFRRAASVIIAIIAMPLAGLVLGRLFIFDPYYGYVVANRDRVTAEAKAASAWLQTHRRSSRSSTTKATGSVLILRQDRPTGVPFISSKLNWRLAASSTNGSLLSP